MQEQYLDLLSGTNSCLLPFLKQQHYKNIPICETLELGFHALALFQRTSSSCLTPCLLVNADLTLQSEEKYIKNSLIRYNFASKNTAGRSGLFIQIPREIELMDSKFDYSLFSSIANFLGVAGLFFGISAFACLESMKDCLSRTANMINVKISPHKYVKNIYVVTFLLVCSVLIISILAIFISRYISSPTETNVALESKLPEFSMSFCNSENITQQVIGNISMWRELADIRKHVTTFLTMDVDGKWKTVWNSSLPSTQDGSILKSVIFPLNNQTLQFCKTLDFQSYPRLTKVRVTALFSLAFGVFKNIFKVYILTLVLHF